MRRTFVALASLAVFALAGSPTAAAQSPPPPGTVTVHQYQVTGPPDQRMNLVILGDGYRHDESWKFLRDVDRNLAVLWSIDPYRSYRNYMNIYLLEIVSQDSGVRCDPDEKPAPDDFKNTELRLIFQNGCNDPLARGVVYGPAPRNSPPGTPDGATQLQTYMNRYMTPLGVTGQNVQTLAIFNSFTYGGIGGTSATTSGGSPQGPLISVHELGHSHGQMADEYPYSSRTTPGGAHPNSEPSSFHHSRLTHDQMVAQQAKWFRWLCEKSESGGIITARGSTCGPPHEGGATRSSNVWRPSEHSIMRWLGFHFDQVGREHMLGRISGRRNANEMVLLSTPTTSLVGPNQVLWVETQHPRYHELEVVWRIGGPNGVVLPTNNSRNLELSKLSLLPGDVVHVTVRDRTDWVRDPALANGPRMTQTRQWAVGVLSTPPAAVDVAFTTHTPTDRAVGAKEFVFVEPTHPADRVLDVTWRLNGQVVPNPHNSRNLDLGSLGLPPGTHSLTATVTDPAAPGGDSQTVAWTVDNVLPTAPRTLSKPLTTLSKVAAHNLYFQQFDMLLEPQDDRPGHVVSEFRLNEDGWFNYFGFPEKPFGTPFRFHWRGTDVKALTYGNLGSGGLSKAAFEQVLPEFGFEPGFGTHKVEHRALDAAGNYGEVDFFKATVLPGGSPACTSTVTGKHGGRLTVVEGVACLAAGSSVSGGVTVRPGASLVASDGSRINGGISSTGGRVVHVFGAVVNGGTQISGTTEDVIVAGSTFSDGVTLTGNKGSTYGVIVVGNTIAGDLACTANDPGATDFDAPNTVGGAATGQCATL